MVYLGLEAPVLDQNRLSEFILESGILGNLIPGKSSSTISQQIFKIELDYLKIDEIIKFDHGCLFFGFDFKIYRSFLNICSH